MQRQGAVILDIHRQILVLTPVAEDMLGWRNDQAVGMDCSLVFNCQDAAGRPMCGQCGFDAALANQEITPPESVQIADPFGGRREMNLSFWYLPPRDRSAIRGCSRLLIRRPHLSRSRRPHDSCAVSGDSAEGT